MLIRLARLAPALVASIALSTGFAQAERGPPADNVTRAYEAAIADLCAGKDRQAIADRLKAVVERAPKVDYERLADPFLADLIASAKVPPAKPDDPPERRLADGRMDFVLLRYPDNWDMLATRTTKEPLDPLSQLVVAERSVIAKLIPLLTDRSPTRIRYQSYTGDEYPQPRVCDVALTLIEYHGKCRFHHDEIFQKLLHELPDDERAAVAARVAEWWREVKDKSVTDGIRAQLPHGRSYPETVWMAQMLYRAADDDDDREHALNALREMVKQYRVHHVGVYAADVLAKLGDFSSIDVFYDAYKETLGHTGFIRDSRVVFYLCKHGRRREWELLHAISLDEFGGRPGAGNTRVWSSVVHSHPDSQPFAIPILGLTLGEKSEQRSEAAFACESLQKILGKDFGFTRKQSPEERLAALKKAEEWWKAEGEAKYTFDYIEKNLILPKDLPLKSGKLK